MKPRDAGACEVAADPRLNGREAHPLWLKAPDDFLNVQPADPSGTATPEDQPAFDLWRIPGRKRLDPRGGRAVLAIVLGLRHARLVIDGRLADGDVFACTVPLNPQLRGRLAEYHALAGLLNGVMPFSPQGRGATRAELLHLRALQALDAIQAGASHREIASALFGPDRVEERWQADGSLRAQVRHLVSRAEAFMRGGYLQLAGITRADTCLPRR